MTKVTRDQVLQIVGSARSRGENPELVGANLEETELLRVKLKGADFSQANLSQSNLSQAKFYQANLNGVDLYAAGYDQTTVWPVNFRPVEMGTICED